MTRPGRGVAPAWRSLLPIYISVALFAAGEQALHVLVSPYLAQGLGQGTATIGLVVATFGAASLVTRLPVGMAYRRDRALTMLAVGGALSTVAFALVPLVGHPLPFAGLMAVDGFGWSIVTTTQLALLVATRPAGLSTLGAMAWYSGFQGIGHTLGGITAGFLGDSFGYATAFLGLAAIPALATAVLVGALRRAGSADLVPAPAASGGLRWRDVVGALGSLPLVVWAGVLVMFYINFVSGFVSAFHPILTLAAGLSLTQIGALSAFRSLASSAVRLGSGPIFSRTGTSFNPTLPLIVLSTAAVVLIPAVRSSFPWQVPLFLALGLSRGLLRVTGSAEAFDGVGDDERQHGLTAGLLHAGLDLGKVAGPAIGGFMAAGLGLATSFMLIPPVLLAVYGLLEFGARRSATRRALSSG